MKNMTRIHPRRPTRGVALLMVMIGLVVCTLLTAGFLSSQGTAIGIVRNERDAEQCRFLAQSGIDLCFSFIKSKPTWREAMTPGIWLNQYPIGNGTVTVTAASADGSSSFSANPTQAVVFHSTAYCNNRNFTLTGTIGPTGGGTVFRDGNFVQGQVILGNNDLTTVALIDSYNSAVAAYNALSPGSNAALVTDSNVAGALTIKYPSTFNGSFTAGPNAILSSTVAGIPGPLGQTVAGPISTGTATETRTPGNVIPPNFSGQISNGPYAQNRGSFILAPGVYDSLTLTNGGTGATTILTNGSYQILHDMNVAALTKIAIDNGANVILYIGGNTAIAGTVKFNSTGTLTIYSGGSFTTTAAGINSGGTTSNLQVLGTTTCSSIQLNGSTVMAGAIYAPQASVTMQTGSSKLYGAVIAHDLTVRNSAQLHYDQALQSLQIDNVTGGSASPGTADYSYVLSGG